ncbi:MAG: MBL fold metallo-hydrolase [Solobacterium sp.]|nr:MBL fold metallo-hydrolase [Solobacterium sp.]
MELIRLTDRVLLYPFEKERDRPTLGYIRGDRMSLAVDAGHSEAHIREFYDVLRKESLPLPSLTVLTHWHWDHTFAMHAANGICISGRKTAQHLSDFRREIETKGTEFFFSLDDSIRKEYAGGMPVIITLPDIVFDESLTIDLGNCRIQLMTAESPHTDDSVIVFAESEKVLFLGDAAGGVFPTWEKDPQLCHRLARTIETIDAEICVESHHTPASREETITDLLSE